MWKVRKAGAKKTVRSRLVAKYDRIYSMKIRLRDSFVYQGELYFRCISCGKVKKFAEADCGHYINRAHMATRFNDDNCNAQCRACNRFDEGNIYNYRNGLVKKIGEPRVLWLEAAKHTTVKYTDAELMIMIKDCETEVKRLKAERGVK